MYFMDFMYFIDLIKESNKPAASSPSIKILVSLRHILPDAQEEKKLPIVLVKRDGRGGGNSAKGQIGDDLTNFEKDSLYITVSQRSRCVSLTQNAESQRGNVVEW